MSIVEVKNLRVSKQDKTICSIDGLSVERGQRVGIVGANGSGKSTLLRVIASLEHDYLGQCKVGVARTKRVYVHQTPFLFRGTVLSNVCYGMRAHGWPGGDGTRRGTAWLERLGISHLANERSERLSGGERKRAALARALAIEPELLLLDEPFAELDESGQATLVSVLKELSGTTVMIAAPDGLPDRCVQRECYLAR